MAQEEVQGFREEWSKNPMRRPRIEKVTINVSVGASGEPLEKAVRILEQLTSRKPVRRRAKKTIRGFGIKKGEPITCVVTLRKEEATSFLRRAFQAIGNSISRSRFDEHGNLSFGIKEHLDVPGTKYDPKLGIIGMDVCATISRLGWRVKARRRARARIGSHHRLSREEAIAFVRDFFGVTISK